VKRKLFLQERQNIAFVFRSSSDRGLQLLGDVLAAITKDYLQVQDRLRLPQEGKARTLCVTQLSITVTVIEKREKDDFDS
jgi:hypothetical protein